MIIAKAAYDAYCTARGWKSVTGQTLPPFDGQTEELQLAWQLAAEAAVNASGRVALMRDSLQACYHALQSYVHGNASPDAAKGVVDHLLREKFVQCCSRDHDYDGNCDVHSAPGVLRGHLT